jgi:hypothetical protein
MPSPNSKAARQLVALLGAPKKRTVSTTSVSNVASRPAPLPPRDRSQQLPHAEAVTPLAASQQLPPPESDESSSNLLTGQNKKTCAATNKKGKPCGAYRSPGSEFCPFHRPEYQEKIQEGRAEGGRRTPYQLPEYVDDDIWNVDFSLYTRAGLQASMEAVMRMLILGRLPTRHASILMRFFDAAIRNLHGTDTLAGANFGDTLQDFMRTSGLIERDLDDQALRERVQRIGDAGATRQEILKANEAFGYTPPPPKQQPSRKSMEALNYDQPQRKRESLITAFWGPGTGEGGKLTMQDIFPNGIPEHQRRE